MCRKFSSTTFAEFKCNVKMPPHSSIEHKPNSIWTLLAVEKKPKRKMFHNITFFRFDKSSFHIFVLRWNRNFVETEERFNSVFYASFVSRFFFRQIGYFCDINLSFIDCFHIFVKSENDYSSLCAESFRNNTFEAFKRCYFSLFFDSILHNIQTWSANRMISDWTRTGKNA